MGLSNVLGATLEIAIADPFELSGTVSAQVAAIDDFASGAERERILAALATPLHWAGATYEYVVVERRSAPGLVDELGLGQAIEINGYGTLSPDSPAPWGVEKWRGGLALLGTARVS